MQEELCAPQTSPLISLHLQTSIRKQEEGHSLCFHHRYIPTLWCVGMPVLWSHYLNKSQGKTNNRDLYCFSSLVFFWPVFLLWSLWCAWTYWSTHKFIRWQETHSCLSYFWRAHASWKLLENRNILHSYIFILRPVALYYTVPKLLW